MRTSCIIEEEEEVGLAFNKSPYKEEERMYNNVGEKTHNSNNQSKNMSQKKTKKKVVFYY